MRETEILVEQQLPKGVFICEHAGFVINKFDIAGAERALRRHPLLERAGMVCVLTLPWPHYLFFLTFFGQIVMGNIDGIKVGAGLIAYCCSRH